MFLFGIGNRINVTLITKQSELSGPQGFFLFYINFSTKYISFSNIPDNLNNLSVIVKWQLLSLPEGV